MLHCEGHFQGCGARPRVQRLASALGIWGAVCNEGAGLLVQALAPPDNWQVFVQQLAREFAVEPELFCNESQVSTDNFSGEARHAIAGRRFVIGASMPGARRLYVPLDRGICAACVGEVEQPGSPRYQHLLNACIRCGPRYTALRRLPFDRESSALAGFPLCDACQQAFSDPHNPRCHEQLISCRHCGPRYRLENAGGDMLALEPGQLLADAAGRLAAGQVLAIQGMGGFHLCCDATNAAAVARIRHIKQRPVKPFAVMGHPEQLAPYVDISGVVADRLRSPARPVMILLRRHREASGHADPLPGVAPGLTRLGVMLPSTALQHMLLKRLDRPLVVTSANRSGEPLLFRHRDLLAWDQKPDALIVHDRVIEQPVEDPVIHAVFRDGHIAEQSIRLGRGLAPLTLPLQPMHPPQRRDTTRSRTSGAPTILAMGGELKNSVAVVTGSPATLVVSPYQGDLFHASTLQAYREFVPRFTGLLSVTPTLIVIDSHPDYHASRFGRELAAQWQVPVIAVQHHHAHAVAVMAEYQLPLDQKVPAIVMDGLGWGDDHTLWGGELLLCDARGYERLATLKPFPLLGGQQAARQPWRNALALVRHLSGAWQSRVLSALVSRFPEQGRFITATAGLAQQHDKALMTSSVGRLFDGVAALLGFPAYEIHDEAEAALWLQQQAERAAEPLKLPEDNNLCPQAWFPDPVGSHGSDMAVPTINPEPFLDYLLRALAQGASVPGLALEFHVWLAQAFRRQLATLCNTGNRKAPANTRQVVLSGGVMQNELVTGLLENALRKDGFEPLLSRQIPVNDNGLAAGQAVIGYMQAQQVVSSHPNNGNPQCV